MKHILGIVASLAHDLDKGEEDFAYKLVVSDDIITWLEMHDMRVDERGNKIFVCNAVEYVYLGPEIEEAAVPITTKTNWA